MLFNNGLIICFGQVTWGSISANSGSTLTITLPVSYTETYRTLLHFANITTTSGWAESNTGANYYSLTQFRAACYNLFNSSLSSPTAHYLIIGY